MGPLHVGVFISSDFVGHFGFAGTVGHEDVFGLHVFLDFLDSPVVVSSSFSFVETTIFFADLGVLSLAY